MWFVHDAEIGGFETYENEEKAREALADNMQSWIDDAYDNGEFSDCAEGITIGEVKEISYLKPVSEREEDGATLEMKTLNFKIN
jgi:hypothetical protein